MSASRKRNISNQRINDAHERKEMKEENQRLIRLMTRSKSRTKHHVRVDFMYRLIHGELAL